MPYITLGTRTLTGIIDAPQSDNPGKWSVYFTPDILAVTEPYFEVYKIVVKGPTNSSFDVMDDKHHLWDTSIYGDANAWDPVQPMLLRSGESLHFHYNTSNPPAPIITIWLRYDPTLKLIVA